MNTVRDWPMLRRAVESGLLSLGTALNATLVEGEAMSEQINRNMRILFSGRDGKGRLCSPRITAMSTDRRVVG